MSDWGAVHSTIASALAGLDQESGEQLDTENFFEAPLARRRRRWRRAGIAARRHGAPNSSVRFSPAASLTIRPEPARSTPHRAIGPLCKWREKASCSSKNDRMLPLSKDIRRVAVIGAHADKGVLSGGGSSQVFPRGGVAARELSEDGRGALDFRSVVAARSDPPRVAGELRSNMTMAAIPRAPLKSRRMPTS